MTQTFEYCNTGKIFNVSYAFWKNYNCCQVAQNWICLDFYEIVRYLAILYAVML